MKLRLINCHEGKMKFGIEPLRVLRMNERMSIDYNITLSNPKEFKEIPIYMAPIRYGGEGY